MNGSVRKGRSIKFLQAGTDARRHRTRPVHARHASACDELTAGQVGYLICNIKALGNVHIGDTITVADGEPAPRPRQATKNPSAWSSAACIPPMARTSSSFAKRSKTLDQRPQLRFRARIQRRPRLRLPLRLPRPAAHGNRAAAPRARFRHRPRANRTERHLRDHDQQWRRARSPHTATTSPTWAISKNFANRSSASTSCCRPISSARS